MLHRPNNLIETRLRKLTQLKVQPERVLKADYKIHGQFALPGTIPYTVGHCDLVLLVMCCFSILKLEITTTSPYPTCCLVPQMCPITSAE